MFIGIALMAYNMDWDKIREKSKSAANKRVLAEKVNQAKTRQGPPGTPEERAPLTAAAPPSANSLYVLEQVQERLGPNQDAPATNTLYRQQKVDVYETQAGWARVSPFYDGAVEGRTGQVARWVPLISLSKKRPADLPQPSIADDPRIAGIPKVGEGGLTKRDVHVLQAAARYFLETGKAQRVEYGDKSTSRPGVYYLNFGGPANHFFTSDDIPELEGRIWKLGQ